jgi:glucosylceramidase
LPVKRGEVLIVSTTKSGQRFHEARVKFNEEKTRIPNGAFHYGSELPTYYKRFMQVVQKVEGIEEPVDSVVNVEVNRTARFQKILGFGGAFTGAVSYNLKLLPKELQDHVYKSYYSKDVGIGYNMMRMSIGGCDFDIAPWTYNEQPEHDPYLTNFTQLDERDIDKVKQIHELKKVTKNNDIRIIGAAWSPPKWMKTNNEYTGMSALREEYYQTWADYHVKFLELMAKNNLPFWAISTGNEPLNGVIFPYFVHFMSLGWDPKLQGKWLAENLGPAMKNSSFTKNVLILGGDDQRYTLPLWFQQMFKENSESCDYLDGFAVHWYADKFVPAKMLDDTAALFPDKLIIATEASSGDKPWDIHKPTLGSWGRFEDYVLDIMEDMNHFVSAWVDWNLILDEEGGPNYAKVRGGLFLPNDMSFTPLVIYLEYH